MKKIIPFTTILLAAASLMAADDKDAVINAAKQLAAADNYTWKTTPAAGGGGRMQGGPVDGKTEKGGFTTVTFTMGDNSLQAVLKDGKGALKADADWQSLSDATKDDGNGFSPARFLAMRVQTLKTPAEEAQSLAAGVTSIKLADGAYSGDLTEEAAKAGMSFGRFPGGGDGPQVTGAKGSVKFWITDGTLSKYEVHNSGHIDFNGNGRDIDRTTTTEIKDIGKTKVEVPAEAKSKVS